MTTKEEKARALCAVSRSYNAYDVAHGIVEKAFNNGGGSLDLYRFGNGNRVTANTMMETAADRKKLLAMYPDAEIVYDTLGCPDWYTRGIRNPDNEELIAEVAQ